MEGSRQDERNSINELIDTQWDVNDDYFNKYNKEQIELIDTQWDVNAVKTTAFSNGLVN